MGVISIQFSGEGQTPDGRRIPIPPQVVMRDRGPCIQVTLSVAQAIADQLLQQGTPIPTPITGDALIDTGASGTCIDDGVAQRLRLPVIDVVGMTSASHADTPQNVYPVRIGVVGAGFNINVARAVGANLAPQNLVALIGRDFLQHCILFYNGTTGSISLAL